MILLQNYRILPDRLIIKLLMILYRVIINDVITGLLILMVMIELQ
jgi:hypothetical protein